MALEVKPAEVEAWAAKWLVKPAMMKKTARNVPPEMVYQASRRKLKKTRE
jgi:hypothetical protein